MVRQVSAAALAAAMVCSLLPAAQGGQMLPTPDHVVVVMLENHSFHQIMDGGGQTAFLRALAAQGANFTNAFAVAHPSQPNYFALFSGSTEGVRDDRWHYFDAPTLAGALASVHKSFAGYVEAGSPRKHDPWESFADSRGVERLMSSFPSNFADLPTVSFVIPDLDHDMHDGTIAEGDRWVRDHLSAYARWAPAHNSLLIVTFDEDDDGAHNRIPTIFVGAHVQPGQYAQRIDHYTVLRTLLAMYGLAPLGNTTSVAPITDIWRFDRAPVTQTAATTPHG